MRHEFFDIFLDEIVVIDVPIRPKIKSFLELKAEKSFDEIIRNILGVGNGERCYL